MVEITCEFSVGSEAFLRAIVRHPKCMLDKATNMAMTSDVDEPIVVDRRIPKAVPVIVEHIFFT